MGRLAGPAVALLLASSAARADDVPARLGFGDFLAPLAIADAPRAERCRACHPAVVAQWNDSRHRVSVTNEVFLDGLAREPQRRCLTCHAPLAAQADDARALLRPGGALPAGSLAHEGITCAVCHLRDGVLLAASPGALPYGHPLRYEPGLREPALCASCHEFRAHAVVDGRTVLLEERLQTTFSEWRAWRAGGGAQTCQQCHMPQASHRFRDTHDEAWLRGALRVTQAGRALVLESVGVGHDFPTGDVFRHLRVEVDGVVRARLGRRFALTEVNGVPATTLVENTALAPGVPFSLPLPSGARRARVTYHRATEETERTGRVPLEALVVELADVALR